MSTDSATSLTLATRNVMWAGGARRRAVSERVRTLGTDVLCLTEAHLGMPLPEGHPIDAEADDGYGEKPGRRMAVLRSRWPWDDLDRVGRPGMPGGRYVSGVCRTPWGPLRVIGVCIPWSHAHVSTGSGEKRPWEDRLAYLAGLQEILDRHRRDTDVPLVVMGDCNLDPATDRGCGAFGRRAGGAGCPAWTPRGVRRSLVPARYGAVTTTGVSGRLTCGSGTRARPQNRVFLASWDDAVAAGFRPCGNCRPTPDDRYSHAGGRWELVAAE